MFTAALFTIATTWKPPKCPLTDEGIKICIYAMQYSSAIEKNKIMPFVATQIDPKTIVLSKPKTERQIPYAIYMWNLKYDKNQHIYKTKKGSQT